MTDIVDAKTRSEMMSKIRGFGNRSTELAFRSYLKRAKVTGWRSHLEFHLELRVPSSSGIGYVMRKSTTRPDFTFRKERLVVFIDGCFWHQCPKHSSIPKQNAKFWTSKLAMNAARDRAVILALKKRGWRVMRIWEHDIPNENRVMQRLLARLSA